MADECVCIPPGVEICYGVGPFSPASTPQGELTFRGTFYFQTWFSFRPNPLPIWGRNRIQGSLLPAKPLVRMEDALDDAAGDLKLRDVANATQANQPSRPPA
jgi:hypothetical protein